MDSFADCKDGIGQTIKPGDTLLALTRRGPALYRVNAVTWRYGGTYTLNATGTIKRRNGRVSHYRTQISSPQRYLVLSERDGQLATPPGVASWCQPT
jgi:hypothetical protein